MNLELCQLVMQGADSKAGYDWLQWAWAQGAYHPGYDMNKGKGYSDFGAPILTPADGVVEFISTREYNHGFGLHVVIYHPDWDRWTHYVHLDRIINIREEQQIKAGQQIATCGKTGTSSPHLHFEVWKRNLWLLQIKSEYVKYPVGWLRSTVEKYYENPDIFLQNIINLKNRMTVSEWAKSAWEWAKSKKIIGENSVPQDKITKEEMVVMLERYDKSK